MSRRGDIVWTKAMKEIVIEHFPLGGAKEVQKHLAFYVDPSAIRNCAFRMGVRNRFFEKGVREPEDKTDYRNLRTPLDELFAPKPQIEGVKREYHQEDFDYISSGMTCHAVKTGIQSGFSMMNMMAGNI